MTTEEICKAVEDIITSTFARLEEVYKYHREGKNSEVKPTSAGSRLVFPMYSNHRTNETRISEQELRFAFVETFYAYCEENNVDLYYSVETPTKKRYSFSDNNPLQDDDGRSAEFDMVIYNEKLKRVCLIEFKANNAAYGHHKDFVKLNKDEDDENILRYFIEVIKTYTDSPKGTINRLANKIISSKNVLAEYRCFALEGRSKRKKSDDKIVGEDISDMVRARIDTFKKEAIN